VVEFSAVSKRYRHRGPLVLDHVTLELQPGTLTRIGGENGSGKSTLLRLACGFSRASAGEVRRTYSALGFVPDRVTPAARMTARSYLAHLGRLAGHPVEATVRSAAEVTERLGLSPGLDAPLGTLSRGNLRKVILAQCLMRPVDFLVMDEPFAALDAAACTELAVMVRERLTAGCTFLIATHTDALGAPVRTLALESGRLHESAAAGGVGPAAERWYVIELDAALPGTDPAGGAGPTRLPGGGYRHVVPAGQVEGFLQAAISAQCRVLRLNPDGPDRPSRDRDGAAT
jgi:ABC-type Mn2+/Zn2+ transport system ATPase subunit